MIKSALLVCFCFFSSYVFAQKLKIEFDYSNAYKTIELFKKENADPKLIAEIVNLNSTGGLIKKIKSDSLQAVGALSSVFSDGSNYSNYQYRFVKKNIDSLAVFVNLLRQNEEFIRLSILDSLIRFVPEKADMKVTVRYILGGYSSGFTFGDNEFFYIGLHQYKNDFYGVMNTCKHEIFHLIQNARFDPVPISDKLEKSDEGLLYVHEIYRNIFVEGSASFIADMRKEKNTGSYLDMLIEHDIINDYRSGNVFYLIDLIVKDARKNPKQVSWGNTYSIIFDWNWNNPGYYAGYVMCKALTDEFGISILNKYMDKSPIYFVNDYVNLVKKKNPGSELNFSDETEKINQELLQFVGQNSN